MFNIILYLSSSCFYIGTIVFNTNQTVYVEAIQNANTQAKMFKGRNLLRNGLK